MIYKLDVIGRFLRHFLRDWFLEPIEEMPTKRKNVYKILDNQVGIDNIPKPLKSWGIVTGSWF